MLDMLELNQHFGYGAFELGLILAFLLKKFRCFKWV